MADKRYFSRHTGTKIDTAVSLVDQKQDLLISGYNIKKINNLDLLGSNSIFVVGSLGGETGDIELNPNQLKIVTKGGHKILEILNSEGSHYVEANPGGVPTDTLASIRIGDVIYEIPGGGGDDSRTRYAYDNTTRAIGFTFSNHLDKTYALEATSVNTQVPSDVGQGFQCCLTFVTGDTPPSFSITNRSKLPLKIVQYGRNIPTYTPAAHCTVTLLIFNDGVNSNLLIYEVTRGK